MFKIDKLSIFASVLSVGLFYNSYAGEIFNQNLSASEGVSSQISATPIPTIQLKINGGNPNIHIHDLNVSTTNTNTTVSVSPSSSADQYFADKNKNAKYFGYYISTGINSTNQTASRINVKVRKGLSETRGRSFYVLGNGSADPHRETDLTIAPASYVTFATVPSNSTHCGTNHRHNLVSDKKINCDSGPNMQNLDLTQFVKVIATDSSPHEVVSQLEFIAIAE